MSDIQSYQDLVVWRKGMDHGADVHRLAKSMPKEEQYRLVSQIQRSSTSGPAACEPIDELTP